MGRNGKYLLVISVLLLCAANVTAQVTQKPLAGQDLPNTWTAPNTFKNINNIRFADQFPGADCGAKINAADADLGANVVGEIWVNTNCGTTWTTPPSISAQHVLRVIQGGTYLTPQITLANYAGIVGILMSPLFATGTNVGMVVLKQANGTNANPYINENGSDITLRDVVIDGNGANNASSGPVVVCVGARCVYQNVTVANGHTHGISFGNGTNADGGNGSKLFNCSLVGNSGSGLFLNWTVDVWSTQTEYENNGRYGIEATAASSNRFVQNDFGGNALGGIAIFGVPSFQSQGWIVALNQFGNNQGHDIGIFGFDSGSSTSNNAAANNFALNSHIGLLTGTAANTFDAVHFEDTNGNNVVGEQVLNASGQVAYRYGVNSLVNGGHASSRNTFSGLVFGGGAFGTSNIKLVSGVDSANLINESNQLQSLLTSPYLVNNDWVAWKDASGTIRNIMQMGADNRIYILGHPTQQEIRFQPTPNTTNLDLTNTALTVTGIPIRGVQIVSDQGTACTNGELALSAGWQSTGSATVTAVAGNGQTCSWTITTGTTTAANPTVTDTLTNALPAATTVCELNIHGGTHTAAAGEGFQQTTLSVTAPVFIFNGTPTAGGATYFITRRCGP